MKQNDVLPVDDETKFQSSNLHRRKFLTNLGLTAVAITGLTACTKNENSALSANSNDESKLGTHYNDVQILNYAFLLEQLEAAFYIKVNDSFYSGATTWEKARLEQIMKHEIAHREFFKTALGGAAIPDMEFNFSSIDFSNRMSVLGASKAFEDTGVSAYNGIAYAINSPDYLVVAGKIVSVEARHAAYIRDLIDPLSFADSSVIDANGLDLAAKPYSVVQTISPYLITTTELKSFLNTL